LADQDVSATSRYAPVDAHRGFHDLSIVLDHLVSNKRSRSALRQLSASGRRLVSPRVTLTATVFIILPAWPRRSSQPASLIHER
jgi:hypothetical protein